MKLYVGINNPTFIENPEGFSSSDKKEALVHDFLKAHFAYQKVFTSISVREDDAPNLADAYGFQFELLPTVIDDLVIVCSGDIQNIIFNSANLKSDCDAPLASFALLSHCKSRYERQHLLLTALQNAKQLGYPYAEARIHRPLRREDCVDPDSGLSHLPSEILLDL